MRKIWNRAGVAGLAVVAASLLAPAAASATTVPQAAGARVAAVHAAAPSAGQTATAGCTGHTYKKIPRNGNVWGWLWYTQGSGGACIGTVEERIYYPASTRQRVTLHIGPYKVTRGPYRMNPGTNRVSWSVHQFFHRTNFKVCLGATNTPGYACATIP